MTIKLCEKCKQAVIRIGGIFLDGSFLKSNELEIEAVDIKDCVMYEDIISKGAADDV